MATKQALSVFLQNQSTCADCQFWRQFRCPDRWFHENTGVCPDCDSARDLKEEHDSDCPARDDRILTQACRGLRNTFRSTTSNEPPESAAASSHGDFDVHSESSFDHSESSFDQDGIERAHDRICEWCSPFHSNSCNGTTRECREMAGFRHGVACQRMVYICRNMPVSNPRDCPLNARIVALALLRDSWE